MFSPQLTPEIWSIILEKVALLDEDAVKWQVTNISYVNLKSLSQCCRLFYHFAAPVVHRTIVLDDDNGFGRGLSQLLANIPNNNLVKFVQNIIITELEEGFFNDEHLSSLMEIIECLEDKADLKEFKSNIPNYLLETFHEYWPSCRLYIKFASWDLDSMVLRHGSPFLISLHYNGISYTDDLEIIDLIESSENLEILKLTLSVSPDNEPAPFTLDSNDRLPALKELEINSPCFAPGQGALWSQCADWSKLQHLILDVNGPQEFIEHFTGRVTNLSYFEIRVKSPLDEETSAIPIEEFLKGINKLEGFVSWNVPKSILPTLGTYHGAFLQTLKLRTTVAYPPEEPSPNDRFVHSRGVLGSLGIDKCYTAKETNRYLNPTDMENIRLWFPKVQEFSFDLHPRGSLTYGLLTPISCLPSLQHLETNVPYNMAEEIASGSEGAPTAFDRIFNLFNAAKADMVVRSSDSHSQVLLLKSLGIRMKNNEDRPYAYEHTLDCNYLYRYHRLLDGHIARVKEDPVFRPRRRICTLGAVDSDLEME